MPTARLYLGDCLHTLRKLPDNSVDSIVTDPPYGLSKQPNMAEVLRHWLAGDDYTHTGGGFMGKSWDSFVPGPSIWRECLRVLKPGGHLLAFAGTRTMDLMGLSLRLAGFELRDSIGYAHDDESNGAPLLAWAYGCLSEDTEVLTEDGWELYSKAILRKQILAYDLQSDVYKWEVPTKWNEYRVESDTAYRIKSDHTDQIVSRGHRVIVERCGTLTFISADELSGVERVPYLRDDFPTLQKGCGQLLLQTVLREGEKLVEGLFSERQGQEADRQRACGGNESRMEGRGYTLQAQGKIRRSGDQVRPVPEGDGEHGSQGWVCDGAQVNCGDGDWEAANSLGVCPPHQPRCDRQSLGKLNAVCNQRRPQAVRARSSYNTTMATVTTIEYSGLIWCPTVSTGAFIARRNGRVFITGNSGFPKSLNVQKATGDEKHAGLGTALKPAWEPILIARKPLAGTVAENVKQFGTGAINVDGCRIGDSKDVPGAVKTGRPITAESWLKKHGHGSGFGPRTMDQSGMNPDIGRWPANLVHDGSEATTAGLGHAARYFYCSKASKRDRDEGCDNLPVTEAAEMVDRDPDSDGMNSPRAGAGRTSGARNFHPTVKPTELMRWLVRLVTPPGGTVADPFTGSGSTGKAAVLEGFNFIGCELGADYMRIAVARIGHVMKGEKPVVFGLRPEVRDSAEVVI